jgi:hypothetical protein
MLTIAVLWTSVLLAQKTPADLLLIHGYILTMDSKDSVVEAIGFWQLGRQGGTPSCFNFWLVASRSCRRI